MINGYVCEDGNFTRENGKKVLHYPWAGSYVAAPDFQKTDKSMVKYEGITSEFEIDNIVCPIHTVESIPEKYNGMSGAAIWRIVLNDSSEIHTINIAGISTEYVNKSIICRGPISLYKSFYPFLLGKLKNYFKKNIS